MKLIDFLLNNQQITFHKNCPTMQEQGTLEILARALPRAVVFDATDVAATTAPQFLPVSRFHCVNLPYPFIWVEADLPTAKEHNGVLMYRIFPEDMRKAGRAIALGADSYIGTIAIISPTDKKSYDPIVVFSMVVAIDEYGKALEPPIGNDDGYEDVYPMGFEDKIISQSLINTEFAWQTLALLHCKNVSIQDHSGLWPSRQARRVAERKGLPGPVKYKTLVVKPLATSGTADGSKAGSHEAKAMHICRGHYATYTEERPLFGKHHGTFWIQPHVRGNPEVAIIEKSYKVKGKPQ